ncbi:MAG: serine/threonine-protein kinase [Ignavibacteria bacterium]|jgi:serine/threonine-protein kinase
MIEIELKNSKWKYDPNLQLGSKGGFGTVFSGKDENGKDIAVKRMNSSVINKINRELRFADELLNKKYNNVISFLDYGQDLNSGDYFLIMPKAQYSLSSFISLQGIQDETETISILFQILNGLSEIDYMIHRDLKPDNILYYENKWKISDFGISKIKDESTSINTKKYWLSEDYAAPEQWNVEKTSVKTDLYALGCIGYFLLTGSPPFSGDSSELKQKHLTESPKPITNISKKLSSLLLSLLRKSPENRPSLERAKLLLESLLQPKEQKSDVFKELENVNEKEILSQASSEAFINKTISEENYRRQIAKEAIGILENINDELFERILDAANSVQTSRQKDSKYTTYFLSLGTSSLLFKIFDSNDIVKKDSLPRSKWDIIKVSLISVFQQTSKPYQWGSNLIFTNEGKSDDYRWMEINFMTNPLLPQSRAHEPFAIDNIADIDKALSPGMDTLQLASTPRYIDNEDIDNFCDRWAELFIKAYKGELQKPSRLPY